MGLLSNGLCAVCGSLGAFGLGKIIGTANPRVGMDLEGYRLPNCCEDGSSVQDNERPKWEGCCLSRYP